MESAWDFYQKKLAEWESANSSITCDDDHEKAIEYAIQEALKAGLEAQEKLKEAYITALSRLNRGDKPYLVSGMRSWTGNELAEEVRNMTPFGVETLLSMMHLAADLALRQKESL